MQIVDTTSHLEKIEGVAGELFGRSARGKRPIVNIAPVKASETGSDGSTRKFVFQVQFYQRSEAEPQAVAVCFGKRGTQEPIQQKARFKVRTGRGVFDPAHAIPQAESLAVFRRRTEQPLQTTTQVRSFADVWLRLRVITTQKKHGRHDRDRCPEFNIASRNELDAVGQH